MNTQSLLNESAGYNKVMSKEAKNLVTKWEKTGLLEGIESDFERSSIATLLENQARELVKEASSTGTSANSEEWAGVALPLVRRIFSEIAAKEFVSVQPMNLPSGLVFYLDFKYGTSQPGFETGAGKDSQTDSVFGITETASEASEGLYGAGRFGYSINDTASSALDIAAALSDATKFTSASVNLNTAGTEYDYDSSFSASIAAAGNGDLIVKVSALTSSIAGFDKEGVRGFEVSGSGIAEHYPAFTKLSGANITAIVRKVAAATAVDKVVIKYHKQPTDITRGDFEQSNFAANGGVGADLGIPELNVELRSVPIVAKTRKLKAQWTPEFAQDLNAYHSVDAEAELTSMLSEYISQEIDLEILDMLLENALTTGYWSARIGYSWNGAGFTSSGLNAAVERYTQQQWFQTLGTQIQRVSNQIHAKTMRGGANFMVVSPDVATILESIPGFHGNGTGEQSQFAFGVSQVGSFANRYQVYKNPYMKENVILLGFKGSQFLETGAVYAPYIPLIMTPLVYDPTNFTPRKGVMTRYAKQMVRGEFYGKVLVHGLEVIG
tara:strand:- start:2978 stop:4636 length:1659 start_codon:yes stop_codon:yes gene_type:complete